MDKKPDSENKIAKKSVIEIRKKLPPYFATHIAN